MMTDWSSHTHGIRLPAVAGLRLLVGHPLLESGDPFRLAAHQDGAVEEQRRAALLDHLHPFGFKVRPVGRRHMHLAAAREHQAAVAPGVGVQDQWGPPAAETPEN